MKETEINYDNMKIVGKRKPYNKGWTDELNGFFKLAGEFRKNKVSMPSGVYRFKTFKEADQWRLKAMLGKYPDHQQ